MDKRNPDWFKPVQNIENTPVADSLAEEYSVGELSPLSDTGAGDILGEEGKIENLEPVSDRVELIGTNQGLPDYEELKGDVQKVEKYQNAIKAIKESGPENLVKWFERVNKFVKLLLEGGIISDAQLKSTRMYHVLTSSSPIGKTIESFDLPGGVIEKFIQSELKEILEAQAQQDSADEDSQETNQTA